MAGPNAQPKLNPDLEKTSTAEKLGGCDGNRPHDAHSGDTRTPQASAGETIAFGRLSRCQTVSEIASG